MEIGFIPLERENPNAQKLLAASKLLAEVYLDLYPDGSDIEKETHAHGFSLNLRKAMTRVKSAVRP